MKRLAEVYAGSLGELRKVRTVTLAAMFMAVSVVVGYFTIEAGPYLKIGFGNLVNEFVYYTFGPVVGIFYGCILDLVKYVARPTGAFFPGFTLITMLGGILYGTVLYKRPLTFKRVLLAGFLVSVICNVILNTWCLSILYGKGMIALLPPRIIKNLIGWPVDALLFYTIAKKLENMGFMKLLKVRARS